MVSYAIDHAIWGLDPAGYRLTNLICHLAAAVLIFLILGRVLPGPAAFCGALVFAVHPLQTEAVTYVSGRRDVLFAALWLGAFLCGIRALEADGEEGGGRGATVGAIGLWILALGTKEMAITLPAALLLWDLLAPPDRIGAGGLRAGIRRRLRRAPWLYGTLVLVGGVYVGFVLGWKNPGAMEAGRATTWWGGSPWTAVLSASRALFHYAGLVLWPAHLSADYSQAAFQPSRGLFAPPVTLWAVGGVLLWIGGTLWAMRTTWSRAALGLALFPVLLLPALQLVPHPERVAERFCYLPLLGPVLLLGLAVEMGVRWKGARVAWLACLLALPLGLRTVERNEDWRNEGTFWRAAVRDQPKAARPRLAWADLLSRAGDGVAKADASWPGRLAARVLRRKALSHYDVCLDILPATRWTVRSEGTAQSALFGRGIVLARLGHRREAIAQLEGLLLQSLPRPDGEPVPVGWSPEHVHVIYDVAGLHKEAGGRERARDLYSRILRLTDGRSGPNVRALRRETHLQLAVLLLGESAEEAVDHLVAAGGTGPITSEEAVRYRMILGRAYLQLQRWADARRTFRRIIEFRPVPQARWGLARALEGEGRFEEAIRRLEELRSDHPDYAPAHAYLGTILQNLGRFEEARDPLREVLRLEPGHREARLRLRVVEEMAEREAAAEADPSPDREERPPPGPEERALLLLRGAERALEGDPEPDPGLAARLARDALDLDPDLHRAREVLGRAHLAAGETGEAARHLSLRLEEMEEASTLRARVLDLLGRALEADGQPFIALDTYREATEVLPVLAHPHLGMARIHESEGDLEAALREARRARELAPEGPLREAARALEERVEGALETREEEEGGP